MWTRKCPYYYSLLYLVLVLATAEFTNAGAKSSPSLDIQLKFLSDGTSQNTHISDVTICIRLPEGHGVDPAEDYLLTISDCMGSIIKGDKSNLQNLEDVCFTLTADFSEFNLEEHIDITVYKIVPDEYKGRRKYKLFNENTMFLAPIVNVVNGDLALVHWNNPDAQLFSISDDTDGSSFMQCRSQICQFIFEKPNHQNYMNVVIQSEDETQIHQTAVIDIHVVEGGGIYELPSSLARITYIQQSINLTSGLPFITVGMEAKGIKKVDCFVINIKYGGHQQSNEICENWDGSAVNISIPHAEFPAELENITIILIATWDSALIDVSKMEFSTSAFDTTIAIVGSDSRDTNAYLRIKVGSEEEDVSVGDVTCNAGETCYYPYSEQHIKERQKTISVIVGPTESFEIIQHDDSIMPFINLDELSEVKLVNEKILEIATNHSALNNSIEVIIFDPDEKNNNTGELKCSDEMIEDFISCNLELNFSMTDIKQLNMVIMMLDPNRKILKSALVVLEDLKLNVKNLTQDIVAANWHHGVGTDDYWVYLAASTKSSMIELKSACSTNTCTAVFSNVEPIEYIFTVQKERNSITKVAKTYTMPNTDDALGDITVSNVIESNGCTKITLDKSELPSLLTKLGVSITSIVSGTPEQTFVPGKIVSEDENSVVYSIPFVFDSNKRKQNSDDTKMVLIGLDEKENVIASTELNFHYQELSTKISTVGASLDATDHSLRVVLADGESLQILDYKNCLINTTCYFIEPESDISVCNQEIDGSEVILCNEGSSEFEELSDLSVSFSTDGHVQVSTTLSNEDLVLEVVVYDEKDTHNILSKDNNYNCPKNQIRQSKYSCSQETKVTKDLKGVWVLVVSIRNIDNTVVQSTKKHISLNTSIEDWVIVLSSIGGIFAVIFIIFATLVIWKKWSTKKQEKNIISPDYDTRREYNSNVNNADEEYYGEDLHMGHLGSQNHYMHDNAYGNPAFAHNENNNINITQNTMQNSFTGHYASSNNANIVKNIIQNQYAEPYTSGNVAKGIPRTYEAPIINHQNLHARHSNPPIQNYQFRHAKHIHAENAYNKHIESDYSSPNIPAPRPKEPIYARLNRDNATASALEPVPLGPIPRISVHPSRAEQYKAITQTTVIPPHGNWDVDI